MLHIGGGRPERRNDKVLYWLFLTLLLAAAWALTIGTGTASAVSVPKAPTGVSASDKIDTNKVRVTWTLNGAQSYEVWRNVSNNTLSATKIASVASSPCDDTSAVPGTIYYYWVKATNAAGTSGFSAPDTGWYTAYTLAWPQGWQHPLGAVGPFTVVETDFWYNFDASHYWSVNGTRHAGIDIKASPNTQVLAIKAGTIVWVPRTDQYGKPLPPMQLVVIVQHSGTRGPFFCVYGHIDAYPEIKLGVQVKAGARLGVVKQAGDVSHLHFGINTSASTARFISVGWGASGSANPTSLGWVDPVPYLRQTLPW
jgi:murein DD-endopeptidase MepM/ murein hydrolase activator NlpD